MLSLSQVFFRSRLQLFRVDFTRQIGILRRPTKSQVFHVISTNSESTSTSSSLQQRSRPWKWTKRIGKLVLAVSLGTIGLAGAHFAYQVFVPDERALHDPRHYYSTWKLRFYASLPWNAFSRMAGGLASREVPVRFRESLFGWFARTYSCRMDEAMIEDLKAYKSFNMFFNRSLKPELRPISAAPLVSPADGVVLHYGPVENSRIEYVKEQDYPIDEFLGPILHDPKKQLYQMEIYLAPGAYHGFHSPARWTAKVRRHYPGLLLSVRPTLLETLPRLFCLNERVVLNGYWKHGFFSVSAVAATNVGDIHITADPTMRTNLRRHKDDAQMSEKAIHVAYLPGERLGEFRLGSTIVLVFEAPRSIRFAVKAGDQLRYGQSLVIEGV